MPEETTAIAIANVPSAVDGFKAQLAKHLAKALSLTELIQKLEANPELLRVMDLIHAAKDRDNDW